MWKILKKPHFLRKIGDFLPSKPCFLVISPYIRDQKSLKKTSKNADEVSGFLANFYPKFGVFPVYGDLRDPQIAKKPRFRPAGHPP